MAFTISKRPDITESIPAALSRAGARAVRESTDKAFQIGINGVGFTLRANGQHPYLREADQVRKEQFDASDQAGEQSLGTWWRRSQDEWSYGEGAEWYEPVAREESANRYWQGQGVDPWTQGRISLLHSTDLQQNLGGTDPVYVSTYRYLGEDGYVVASDDTISYKGPSLSGETRTNHLENPRFFNRGFDGGAIPNSALANESSGGGRNVTFIGSTGGVTSFTMGSHPAGVAGLDNRQLASDLPDVFSFAADFTSAGSSTAAVMVKYEVAFYNAAGGGMDAGLFTEEVRVGKGGSRRFELHNLSAPEDAYEFRIICFVRKETDFEFAANMTFIVGVSIIEEGGIVGAIWSGGTPDAGGIDYSWIGATNDSKSTKVVPAVADVTLGAGSVSQPAAASGRVYHGRSGAVGYTSPGVGETVVATCTGDARVWWVKSRLIVAVGTKLYWVNHTVNGQVVEVDGIEIADGGTGWTWIDIADSPDSILLAGHDGTNSAIYSVTVTDDGVGLPEFTGAAEVARLPYGERITCMGTYLGAFVALGTSRGIRIGLVGDSGRVQYGPSLKSLDGVSDVSFYDTFAYFAVTAGHPDGSSGLWRVDLSTEITNTGRHPFASDIYVPTNESATSVAFMGGSGRPVMVAGQGVYLQSEEFLTEGWFSSGRVRFRTTSNKDFQHLRVSGSLEGGTFDHRAIVPGSTDEHRISVQTPQTGTPLVNLSIQGGPLFEWMQIKTYITGTGLKSPRVESWALAAIPQPSRSRLIRYPLQVWDDETTHLGEQCGYEGFAFDRISVIEAIEDSGMPVLVEDARTGESFVASIESAQFVGVSNSDMANDNWGGTLDLTVRIRP